MTRSPGLPADLLEGASDIAAPTNPIVAEIFRYWDQKRGMRRMPSRNAIDPVELRELVHHIMLIDVVAAGKYRMRLVGGAIADFAGRNLTGEWVEAQVPPTSAAILLGLMASIVEQRAPRFRAGQTHFHATKSHRRFEACFLPLSPDDDRVDKIMIGLALDRAC